MEYQIAEFGEGAKLIQLKNKKGLQLDVSNYGARIVHLYVPTESGKRNIVLGFPSTKDYVEKDSYIGATIGRVAGRITHGVAHIGDETIQLVTQKKQNNHTLHGGPNSFSSQFWDYEVLPEADRISVRFLLKSEADENGFPGNLQVEVTYTLTETDTWELHYRAVSDAATLFNPTNHVYFNLTGDCTQPVDEHTFYVDSQEYLEVDAEVIATGRKVATRGTALDFTQPKKLSATFQSSDPQVALIGGLDHPFLLETAGLDHLSAKLTAPDEKIAVEMYTEEPSVVIYTTNVKDNGPEMAGKRLVHHGGITLETQVPPGANEHPELGSIVIQANEVYTSETVFKIVY